MNNTLYRRIQRAYRTLMLSRDSTPDPVSTTVGIRHIRIEEIRDALKEPGDFEVNFQISNTVDPLSQEYKEIVFGQYEQIAGRKYQTDYEEHPFDVGTDQDFSVRPWPYCTSDAAVVGEHLIATGHMLRSMMPKPGERVLEMGAGWGNLVLPLAMIGCVVTALELEPRYVNIIRKRAERAGVLVKVVKMKFLDLPSLNEKFDLIIFCAAFHHCHDHQALLRMVVDHLAPGGRLALCGEPMDEAMGHPWGLNPRREGINQIVTHGWFELVFRVSYLLDLLKSAGLNPELKVCPETAMGNVIMATRAH
jgi:2-polyprenyl-3-methyl-5-hydroxy-6-metoxy-1,4-benzoquinol methylase